MQIALGPNLKWGYFVHQAWLSVGRAEKSNQMFCFYGLLNLLLSGIALHWSLRKLNLDLTGERGEAWKWVSGCSWGYNFMSDTCFGEGCILSLPILTLWYYHLSIQLLAQKVRFYNLRRNWAKQNKAAFGGVVLFCCSSQLSILCKTWAMLKSEVLVCLVGVWVVFFSLVKVCQTLQVHLAFWQLMSSFLLKLGGKLNTAVHILFFSFSLIIYIISWTR